MLEPDLDLIIESNIVSFDDRRKLIANPSKNKNKLGITNPGAENIYGKIDSENPEKPTNAIGIYNIENRPIIKDSTPNGAPHIK